MNRNQFKLNCWIKLKKYFVNDFVKSEHPGLCSLLLSKWESYLFSEKEIDYLTSEINDDTPMGYAYLFPYCQYEPRLSYIKDKIKKYEVK